MKLLFVTGDETCQCKGSGKVLKRKKVESDSNANIHLHVMVEEPCPCVEAHEAMIEKIEHDGWGDSHIKKDGRRVVPKEG